MPTLRLLNAERGTKGHDGDMLACAYTPDGKFVLTGGWDGHLRLWETEEGRPVGALRAGAKPVSTCAVTHDGKVWISGSMDGLLGKWDAVSQQQISLFLGHTRPISALEFSPDGNILASSSWDGTITLWRSTKERDGRTLNGHGDIVAGCRFTPDGYRLISWSFDGTLRVWETAFAKCAAVLEGHADRVTAGAICPDGRWLVSGSRDGTLKLWELAAGQEMATVNVRSEVRACFFLLDAASLLVVDGEGRVVLLALPGLEYQARLATRLRIQCAALSPSGGQLALGCADGTLRLVAVDGFDQNPLVANLTQTTKTGRGNLLNRLLGKKSAIHIFLCTCPACHQSFEPALPEPGHASPCPFCQRHLRFSPFIRTMPASEPVG